METQKITKESLLSSKWSKAADFDAGRIITIHDIKTVDESMVYPQGNKFPSRDGKLRVILYEFKGSMYKLALASNKILNDLKMFSPHYGEEGILKRNEVHVKNNTEDRMVTSWNWSKLN